MGTVTRDLGVSEVLAQSVDVKRELDPERSGVEQALEWLRTNFQITDDETLATAWDMLGKAKGRWKDLEEKRTALTKPLLQVKRGIDDLFSPVLTGLANTELILKAKIGTYTAQVEAQRRALMQASAAEHQAGGVPTAIIPEPAKPAAGGSVRVFWNFRITDPNIVPRELCSPDPAKVQQVIWYADTGNPPRPIPGLEFFQDQTVSARATK